MTSKSCNKPLILCPDAAGNLTREVASYDPWSSSRFFIGTTNYTYDNKDQLTNESSTRYSPRNDTFGYDAMGNPLSWKGTTRSFNANNQETTGGTTQFNYDGNGNPTTYKGNGATFNENDKLTRLTNPGGTVLLQAGYRSDGLRAWKSTGTDTTYFLYDGDQLVCEFYGDANTLSTINVWGANGLLGRQRGTNNGTPVDCYMWDDRGNIAQVLNPNNSVAVNFNVTAWGDVTRDQSWSGPYFGLGGQWGNYLDVETGLTLCGQRYYDPSGGRWINRDPISYNGGLNVYGYCANNPINKIDPEGLRADIIFDPRTNRVLINIPILFQGNGSNNKAVRYGFSRAIEKAWSGKIGKYTVKTTVIPAFGHIPYSDYNVIQLQPGKSFVGSNRAHVNPNCITGTWFTGDSPLIAAHEAGHLMGLGDRYKDVKQGGRLTAVAKNANDTGWNKNIMGQIGQLPDGHDIKSIINNGVNTVDQADLW